MLPKASKLGWGEEEEAQQEALDSLKVSKNLSISFIWIPPQEQESCWSGQEMAQHWRALILPENPGSGPSTHMAAHNCL